MKKLTLDEIKKTELEILLYFDRICRKNGLKYSMCAGTLLGAVRHQGFIPWDDDIDLCMPRPDYEKLIELNRRGKLFPRHLELCCFEEGTLDSPYMKIMDRRTRIREENYTQKDVTSLWIDIFPMDGLPDSMIGTRLLYKTALNLCKLSVATVVHTGYGKTRLKRVLKPLGVTPVSRLIGRRRIGDWLTALAARNPYKERKYCGMVTWAWDGPGQRVRRKEFEKLVELPFEGHPIFAMSCWDKHLRGVFGDYMQLPPEEDRITHDLEVWRVDPKGGARGGNARLSKEWKRTSGKRNQSAGSLRDALRESAAERILSGGAFESTGDITGQGKNPHVRKGWKRGTGQWRSR